MRDDVERAGEIVPILSAEGDVRRQSLAEHHHAAAVVERVDEVVFVIVDIDLKVRTVHRVHEVLHSDVGVVQTLSPESLEVVVVGISGIDMGIADRAVAPVVVGVGAQIVRRQVDAADQKIVGPDRIAFHVIGLDRWRPQIVAGLELSRRAAHADFLGIAEHTGSPADSRLSLSIAVIKDRRAGPRVE